MTEPSSTAPPPQEASPDHRPRFGLTTFAIQGRQAPGLFVVGWAATAIGASLTVIILLGAAGVAAAVLSLLGFALLSVGLILLAGSQTIERKAAGAAYPGPSPVLVFLAGVATALLAAFLVGLPLSAIADAIPAGVGDLLAAVIQAGAFLLVIRLTVTGAGALDWADMGLRVPAGEAVRRALGGAVFAGPAILITSVIGLVAVSLVGVTPPSPLPPTGTSTGLLLHLLAGAVIAPVYEEVMFRGVALTAWRQTVGARSAIVRSSLLFVVAHVLFVGGGSFREAVSVAFVGGVVRVPIAFLLGWLYVRTGSLWGPIGLHAAFNAVLIVLGEVALRQ